MLYREVALQREISSLRELIENERKQGEAEITRLRSQLRNNVQRERDLRVNTEEIHLQLLLHCLYNDKDSLPQKKRI
jgi:hypothetical protein